MQKLLLKEKFSMLWTEEEIELVKIFNTQGMSDLQIAKEIDRPVSSTTGLRDYLGLKNNTTKKVYKHLYIGTVEEVQSRLIKLLQETPNISYTLVNSKDSNIPSARTFRKYFGSWESALIAAGISTNFRMKEGVPTTVYLIEFEGFYKIGITQQSILHRFYGYPPYSIVLQHSNLSLKEARELEKQWLKNVKKYKYMPSNFPAGSGGINECFKF